MWFNRHPLNNSLVVFVHGIFGDKWGTWHGVPGIIQNMAEYDPRIRSYDCYSFQYDSTAFHQPPLIPFAVDGLRQLLTKIQGKYETVVLIAHSQGGLLSKAYILEELQAGNGFRYESGSLDHAWYTSCRPKGIEPVVSYEKVARGQNVWTIGATGFTQ